MPHLRRRYVLMSATMVEHLQSLWRQMPSSASAAALIKCPSNKEQALLWETAYLSPNTLKPSPHHLHSCFDQIKPSTGTDFWTCAGSTGASVARVWHGCDTGSGYRARGCFDKMRSWVPYLQQNTYIDIQPVPSFSLKCLRVDLRGLPALCHKKMGSTGCTGTLQLTQFIAHSKICTCLQPSIRNFRHHQRSGWRPNPEGQDLKYKLNRRSHRQSTSSRTLVSASAQGDLKDSYDVVIIGAGRLRAPVQ